MLITRESSSDIEAIDEVHREAFATPVEAKLVHALRADAGWVPALSLVAGIRRRVVGHVVCTEGTLGEETVLGLGPLGVRSESQRHGIGSALMHAVLGAAAALDYPMVCLLGEPAHYRRFGFVTGSDVGVVPEVAEWGTYFQVRVFRETAPGPFHYAEPFRQL
jgi:putative acetyltransferase